MIHPVISRISARKVTKHLCTTAKIPIQIGIRVLIHVMHNASWFCTGEPQLNGHSLERPPLISNYYGLFTCTKTGTRSSPRDGTLSQKWLQQPFRDRDLSHFVCSVNFLHSITSHTSIRGNRPAKRPSPCIWISHYKHWLSLQSCIILTTLAQDVNVQLRITVFTSSFQNTPCSACNKLFSKYIVFRL